MVWVQENAIIFNLFRKAVSSSATWIRNVVAGRMVIET